ncbi:MAG: hypothetical protein WD801_13690 [Gemmatimonadaceae bacterium]
MRFLSLSIAAGVVLGLSSCTESTEPSLFDDDDVAADIATSAGEAIASAIGVMSTNQLSASLSVAESHHGGHGNGAHAVDVTRSRTCLDADGAVVTGCTPIAAVRKIVTHATVDGTRGDTRVNRRGETVTWSGAVHRVMDDTLTRVFDTADPPSETARVHDGVATADDTTTFTNGTMSRTASESAIDSVRAVTWNLPRSANPWPVSGSIVRNTAATVTVSDGDRTETRSFSRRIQVTFPADAQGNVTLQIGDQVCQLNLVTRRIVACE